MPESIQVAIIGALSALLGGAVMWIIALRKMPKEMKVLEAEEAANLSQALNDATSALINRTTAANAERKDFENRINELEAHRDLRGREIFTLQQKIEQLNRDYVQEVQSLRDTIKNLQAQVDEGNARYEALKRQTLKLYQALQGTNVAIEIDDSLRDTLERIKAVK